MRWGHFLAWRRARAIPLSTGIFAAHLTWLRIADGVRACRIRSIPRTGLKAFTLVIPAWGFFLARSHASECPGREVMTMVSNVLSFQQVVPAQRSSILLFKGAQWLQQPGQVFFFSDEAL